MRTCIFVQVIGWSAVAAFWAAGLYACYAGIMFVAVFEKNVTAGRFVRTIAAGVAQWYRCIDARGSAVIGC